MKLKIIGVLICFFLSFSAINYWSHGSFNIAHKEQRTSLQKLAIKHATYIRSELASASSSQQWLNYKLSHDPVTNVDKLRPVVQYIVDNSPVIKRVTISPNNVTAIAIPFNQESIGNQIITPAREDGDNTPFYEPPFLEGGRSMLTKHVPISNGSERWGTISYTIDLELLLGNSYIDELKFKSLDYQLVYLSKYQRELLLIESAQPISHRIYSANIGLPNIALRLNLSPSASAYSTSMVINVILSIMVASIFTLVCYLGFTEPYHLRRRLEITQKALEEMTVIQKSIIEGVDATVLFVDPCGQVSLYDENRSIDAHLPANILFKQGIIRNTDQLFEEDGTTAITPNQHPLNRTLFNGEPVALEVIAISDKHVATRLKLTSVSVQNSEQVIGALFIEQKLSTLAISAGAELSRTTILDMLETDEPLDQVIEFCIRQTQEKYNDIIMAVSIADDNQRALSNIYAPDLPLFFRQSIIDSTIDQRVMSSNSAISQNKLVIVEDINLHPYWIDNKEAANNSGLRACWSQPIRDAHGMAIGSVDFYSSEVLPTTPNMVVALKDAANIIELILVNHQDIYRLNRMSLAVQHSNSAVTIIDKDGIIEYINPKYSQISGDEDGDVIGTLSPLLDQNTTEQASYRTKIDILERGETWQGDVSHPTKGGKTFHAKTTMTPILDRHKKLTQVVITQEIQHQLSDDDIRSTDYHKSYDAITGLLTHHAFLAHLAQVLSATKQRHVLHCLCSLTIVEYKHIEHTLGDYAANELLRQVAQVLNQVSRKRDITATLAPNKFVMLLENCQWLHAQQNLSQLLDNIQSFQFHWQEQAYSISLLIGVAEMSAPFVNTEVYLQQAESALDSGIQKQQSITLFQLTEKPINDHKNDLYWSSQIRHALSQSSFSLVASPIHTISQSMPASHYTIKILLPSEGKMVDQEIFGAAALRYNLSASIDKWMIEHCIDYLSHGVKESTLRLSISLSEQTVQDDAFSVYLLAIHERNPHQFNQLNFEVSEQTYMYRTASCQRIMNSLAQTGCRFIINDFGHGFCSFTLLHHANFEALKLDQSILLNKENNKLNHHLMRAIAEHSQMLSIAVIAPSSDYTETELAKLGISHCQVKGSTLPLEDIR